MFVQKNRFVITVLDSNKIRYLTAAKISINKVKFPLIL